MVTAAAAEKATERPLTVDDLASLPDDGNRYEIIGGELFMTPAPVTKHQWVSVQLLRPLANYLEESQTGVALSAPFDVKLTDYDVVEPDIIVILKEHRERLGIKRLEGAPDLVVEIISPSTAGVDRVRKSALYAIHGVQEYWLIDPETEHIIVQALHAGRFSPVRQHGTKVRSGLLTGFEIDPAELFAFPEWMTSEPTPGT